MQPAEEIYCEKSSKLKGKTVVIGVTGSIAATECFATIRELVRNGANVIPVMTPSAQQIVTPLSLEFASGKKTITEITGQAEHVDLMGDGSAADVLVVYPASANTISKIANGIVDTPVTAMANVALGSKVPIIVAPAMHDAMYRSAPMQKNIETLRSWGVTIVGPRIEDDRAKVSSRDEVIASVYRMMSKDDLRGKKFLVIGGRSEEPIDSMRIITNRSTGLMAVRIAERAYERGADVEMWMGGCSVPLPDYIVTKRFDSVSDLTEMIKGIDHDIVIVPAALADFTPAEKRKGKIASSSKFDMMLDPVPKVLPLIRKKCANTIGFKAESGLSQDELVAKARSRLKEYDLKAVIANDIDSAGKSSASMILVTANTAKSLIGTKADIANAIMDFCSEKL
jgi:phosphopantothenoylcysteine decarboxylase/phosphopantothenate--cysteine ligase